MDYLLSIEFLPGLASAITKQRGSQKDQIDIFSREYEEPFRCLYTDYFGRAPKKVREILTGY